MRYNTYGDTVLRSLVTPGSFRGPALIVVGQGIEADARWTPWETFAASLDCPLIAFEPTARAAVQDVLVTAFAALSPLFEYARARLLRWSNGFVTRDLAPCGPIIAAPDTELNEYEAQYQAWQFAKATHRITGRNLYGKGMLAIGPETQPGLFGPPVYKISPVGYEDNIATLLNLWLGIGGITNTSQVAQLQALDGLRPRLSSHIAPYLVPYLLLDEPS